MSLLHGELDLATSDPTKWMLHIEPLSLRCSPMMDGVKVTFLGQGYKGTWRNDFSDFYLGKMGPVVDGVDYSEITRWPKGAGQPENTTNIQISITGHVFPPCSLWQLRHKHVTKAEPIKCPRKDFDIWENKADTHVNWRLLLVALIELKIWGSSNSFLRLIVPTVAS